METAKITFYSVDRCGLYAFDCDEPIFGDLNSILNQLLLWAKRDGKSFAETCTYAIEESEDVARTYCYDIIKNNDNGDFLLVTWNETPSYEGKVAAVRASSKVGEAQVEFTKLPEDSIPGYATYFWFVPSKSVFATITLQHKFNGKRGLDKYIKEFISKFSDYVVLGDSNDSDFPILGYSENHDDLPRHLYSRFKTSILRKPGNISYIVQQRTNVTKLVRHNKLSLHIAANLELWQLLLNNLGLKQKKTIDHDINLSYSFQLSPSETELHDIIQSWEQDHESKWDDVGFVMRGAENPIWLSNSLARDDFDLDVKRVNDEAVDPQSLLAEITKKRDLMLRLLET